MERSRKKSGRIADAIRKRALSYPQSHEDFRCGDAAHPLRARG